MSASNYLENAILDHIFGESTYSAPANIYVALCTTAPTDTSTGSTLVEATYTGYARKSTAASDWGAASGGQVSNTGAIVFNPCTAGTSTVTHFALVDASSNGNVLFWGALTASLAVSAGITPQFAIGELDITAD